MGGQAGPVFYIYYEGDETSPLGPDLITIPDKWLLDFDMERDDSSDELSFSPNVASLSRQSGM